MVKVHGYLKMILAVFVLLIALGLSLGGYTLFSQGDISSSEFCTIAMLSIGCLILSFSFGKASHQCFREWRRIEEQCRQNGLPPPSLSNVLKIYYENFEQDDARQFEEMEALWGDDWKKPFDW